MHKTFATNKVQDKQVVRVVTHYAPPAVRRSLRPGRCSTSAAHHLHLQHPAHLASIAVGTININEIKNINDVASQPTIPTPLQVYLWPFHLESDGRVTCDVSYLFANFGLPRPLCSGVIPEVRDTQTDRRQTKASLNDHAYGVA